MSTRGCIARKTDKGFEGTYHHWDSYPTALGATLFELYRGDFACDLDDMMTELIDKHPRGWSTLNGDSPECYCHDKGEGEEDGWVMTEENAQGSGCEWAYVFHNNGKPTMLVQSSYRKTGEKMIGASGSGDPNATWRTVAEVKLDGPEPDWDKMD